MKNLKKDNFCFLDFIGLQKIRLSRKMMAATFMAILLVAGIPGMVVKDFTAQANTAKKTLTVTDLRLEDTVNPFGLNQLNPRFSWKLISSIRGDAQTAYEIEVASTIKKLKRGKADVWKSGRVVSSDQLVTYAGSKLVTGGQYYWRVRVWNAANKVSGWSLVNNWEMGLLEPSDWKGAQWIRVDGITTKEAAYAGHYLKKLFNVESDIEFARLYVSATGMVRNAAKSPMPKAMTVAAGIVVPSLNGDRVGDRQLDPAPTGPMRALYAVYDVKSQIKKGSNVIGLKIGGDGDVIAMLEIKLKDGTTQYIITDKDWVTHPSPLIHADRFAGVEYDANLELPGWNTPAYANNSWVPVKVSTDLVEPIQLTSSATLPPMKIIKIWKPKSIEKNEKGDYVVDLGQTVTGRLRFKLSGTKGQEIKIKYTEENESAEDSENPEGGGMPDFASMFGGDGEAPDGEGMPDFAAMFGNEGDDAPEGDTTGMPDFAAMFGGAEGGMAGLFGGESQTDKYIFGKDGVAEWSPEFAYYGGRYITISGLTSAPEIDNLSFEEVRTDLQKTGTFETSIDVLNKIHEGSLQTTLNNAHGIPEDCPHREKRGWSADGYVTNQQAFANFEMKGFYEKWIQDLRDAQRENGSFTDIAPAEIAYAEKDGDSMWGQVGVEMPWDLYMKTGDISILELNYPAMARFIDWTIGQAKDYTLTQGTYGGDWSSAKKTHDPLIRTALWYMSVQHVVESARILNKQEDVIKYSTLAENIKKSFNNQFLDRETGAYGKPGNINTTMTQASLGIPLAVGLVPDDMKEKVNAQLVNYIKTVSNSHPESGLSGLRYVLEGLKDSENYELFHTMATQIDAPSWGHMVLTGPGTLWEGWSHGSKDHAWPGSVDAYFYKIYGGINELTPGFKTVQIKPYIPENMSMVKTSQETPYGKISSNWVKQGGKLQLDVAIPVGSTAEVVVPVRSSSSVSIIVDGKTTKDIASVKGIEQTSLEPNKVTYKVVSGNYKFEVSGY